jgi:hypothetical protein
MQTAVTGRFELTPQEQARLDRDGLLVREAVFDAAELAAIADDCEALTRRVLDVAHGTKHRVGSYMFELQKELSTYAKWEPDFPDVLQGIEPFAHLSPELAQWGMDPRLTGPAKAISQAEEVVLFTEKLNHKRARHGGRYILHQDFPYWEDENPVAHRVATAMIMLDDSTRENGCLEAAPGSHREGVQRMRQVEGFGGLEMDPAGFDESRLAPLEMKAGAVVWFGAFLVHRSAPNRSEVDRRALLYSYQPAGYPHAYELARARAAARAAAADKDIV